MKWNLDFNFFFPLKDLQICTLREDLPWKELLGWEVRKPKEEVSFLASGKELWDLSLSTWELEGLEHVTLTLTVLTRVDAKYDFSTSCYK